MALDVIFIVDDTQRSQSNFEYHKSKFPFSKKLKTSSTRVEAFKEAAKLSNTSCFFVVEPEYRILNDFDFSFKPEEHDKNYVHIFKHSESKITDDIKEGYNGVYLFSKKILKTDATELDLIGDGIKFNDIEASKQLHYDVIVLTQWAAPPYLKIIENMYGKVKVVNYTDRVQGHIDASKIAETDSFFVIDDGFIPTNTVFDFKPYHYELDYLYVWSYEQNAYGGIKLFNKEMFNDRAILKADFINNYGVETKWVDEIGCTKSVKYDIIFISYDEENAEHNWNILKTRFPKAKRVHKVKGILNAHIEASKLSSTGNFFVVDGDTEILDTFDFDSINITTYEEVYVRIWKSRNPLNGLEYGYGGVKLFHKKMFENLCESAVDMSTLLGSGVIVVDTVSSITKFNSSGIQAFRGAFRECSKLSSGIIKNQNSEETKERLNTWLTVANGDFAEDAMLGAIAGEAYGTMYSNDLEKLQQINNYLWLRSMYAEIIMNKLENELLYTKYDKIDTRTIVNLTNLLYDENIDLSLSEIRDCFSRGQLVSKFWLIDELNKIELPEDLKILILGGWIGSLSNFLFQHYKDPNQLKKIASIDRDKRCEKIADLFNIENVIDQWRFKAFTADMMQLNYERTVGIVNSNGLDVEVSIDWNLLINTSCEHLDNVSEWFEMIPVGKMVVVQSNNFFACDQHTNCVSSLEALEEQCKFGTILYKGILPFELYDRYMIIGIK